MPNCSQLPTWVSYSQALTVPILAVIVAMFGAWIAARQMLTAHKKLQHDVFEKHYDRQVAVYEATRKFLADVFYGNISEDEIRAYGLKTLDARFLFDDNLHKYLKEVSSRVTVWNRAKSSVEHEPPGDERDEFMRQKEECLNWIRQQGDEQTGFTVRFMPFLKYKPIKHPWWLRWPS
jgi:hypothetical protein